MRRSSSERACSLDHHRPAAVQGDISDEIATAAPTSGQHSFCFNAVLESSSLGYELACSGTSPPHSTQSCPATGRCSASIQLLDLSEPIEFLTSPNPNEGTRPSWHNPVTSTSQKGAMCGNPQQYSFTARSCAFAQSNCGAAKRERDRAEAGGNP